MNQLVTVSEFKSGAIHHLIEREGGFSDHPSDRGGATRWGITENKAREHGYAGDMSEYPLSAAFAVYGSDYWDRLMLDDVASVSSDLACQLFDFGVNSGPSRAAKSLQRLLNALNSGGDHYSDIQADGVIGSNTMEALEAFHKIRGDYGLVVLAESLGALRISLCVGITENNDSQEAFTFGWLSRIVHL